MVPRNRIVFGRDIVLGPGRVERLERIAGAGSLRKAAAAGDADEPAQRDGDDDGEAVLLPRLANLDAVVVSVSRADGRAL
jgi:hypothetical protein